MVICPTPYHALNQYLPITGLWAPVFFLSHVRISVVYVWGDAERVSDGHITADHSDPYVEASSSVMQQFSEAAAPGRWLVDLVPIRKPK